MVVRLGFVVCLAMLAACGSKKDRSEPENASVDETYVNKDLAPLRAQLEAGLTQAQDTTDTTKLVQARSYIAGFLVGATKLAPPTAWKASHDTLVEIGRAAGDAVDMVQMATDAAKPELITEARAALAKEVKRYDEWKTALKNGLASANIKEAPLPAPPAPTTMPPKDDTPSVCGGPCPCTETSIEKQGNVIVACNFSRDFSASNVYCAVGRVTFDPKTGELASCDAAAMFSPYPPEVAGTPAEKVVVCGAGPVTRNATGLATCILHSDVVVGETTIAAKSKVVFGDKGAVVQAVTPDGKGTCFAGDKVTPCANTP